MKLLLATLAVVGAAFAAHTVKLPSLPYPYGALEPYIDSHTMTVHHTAHHAGYVSRYNKALQELEAISPELAELPPSKLLPRLDEVEDAALARSLRNNGGGAVNHALYWLSMTPKDTALPPSAAFRAVLAARFGSVEDFHSQLRSAAMRLFGSGWVFLVLDGETNSVELVSTANQDAPFKRDGSIVPLLALDVWEHAYYIKHQYRRGDYVDAFMKIIDWPKLEQRYSRALSRGVRAEL